MNLEKKLCANGWFRINPKKVDVLQCICCEVL
jgi:hypothetical protein